MILFIFTQIALAESLFTNRLYELALTEYKRVFFFDSTAQRDLSLRLHYTISALNTNFLKGYEEYDKLLKDFPDIGDESRIILGRELIKNKHYSLAIDILRPTREKRLLGLCYLLNGEYYNALDEFQNLDEEIALEVKEFLKKPKKSITCAMILSMFLPGWGEIYAGDFKRGLQDFIITSASGLLLFKSFKDKKYVDAGIIISLLFNRFYFGSISNAGRIAQRNNERLEKDWLDYIKKKYSKDF
jgi:TM2 domain-containing membrane protein YozV